MTGVPPGEARPSARLKTAATRSQAVAALRDRLRRMLDDPASAETLARALRNWMGRDRAGNGG